jgi:hypothetical protein
MISADFMREVMRPEVVIKRRAFRNSWGIGAGCLGIHLVLYASVFIILAITFVLSLI